MPTTLQALVTQLLNTFILKFNKTSYCVGKESYQKDPTQTAFKIIRKVYGSI